MWRSGSRSALIAVAVVFDLWSPRTATAQLPADSVLLSLPRDSSVTCEEDSSFAPRSAPVGARAFTFSVGRPSILIRDPAGRVFAPGGSPREISVVFDTTGRPLMLADLADITRWRHGATVVYFPVGSAPFGFRQVAQTDSAAAMARVQREGLGALDAASREATQTGPQEPLDSLMVARATDLAIYLWPKRCPRERAKG